MTPEQLAQDAAAKVERQAIEKARELVDRTHERMDEFYAQLHAALDDREARNVDRCPLLVVTTSRHRLLDMDVEATCCEACGLWIPESASKEGEGA